MNGKGRRSKGAAGEREVFALLNGKLKREVFKRNISQARGGGCDSDNNPIVAIEVKRQQQLQLSAWLEQAKQQAKPGQIPVLAYRRNREPWQFLIIADASTFADLYEVLEGT